MLGDVSMGGRRWGLAVLLWATAAVLGGSPAAYGHTVHVSAHGHDGMIHGEAHFADDTPVRGAMGRAFDPADEPTHQRADNGYAGARVLGPDGRYCQVQGFVEADDALAGQVQPAAHEIELLDDDLLAHELERDGAPSGRLLLPRNA